MGRPKMKQTKEDRGTRISVLLDQKQASMLKYIQEYGYLTTTTIVQKSIEEFYANHYDRRKS